MRVLPIVMLTVLLGASAVLRCQTEEDNRKRCGDSDPDIKIGGCTAVIQSGQETNANLAVAFDKRGNAYDDKGEYDRAIQDYDEAIRLNPSFGHAFDNRGNAYYHKRDYDRAIQDHDVAIRLDPGNARAFNNRGGAYDGKGEYDRAIQDYDEAIRLNPGYALAFNNRGNAYDNKGDYDRAIQDYGEAIRLNPSYASAFSSRGDAYNSKGDYDRAIQDYGEAIRLNPSDASAFFSRGNAYDRKGDHDRAIEDYDRAIKLKPDRYDLRARGEARFEMGHFGEAEADFAEALKADPTDAYSALWLYLAQMRAGQPGRKALEQNAKQIALTAWPGQVIELYLGAATPDAVLSAAGDTDVRKSQGQHCEAYFFLAERDLLDGDRRAARGLFQKALDTGAILEAQFTAAKAELDRLPAAGTIARH